MRYGLTFILLLFAQLLLVAQPGTLTEVEVTFEKYFIEAKQQALLGNVDKAISLFEALIKKDPENDVLHYELGRLYYTQEENIEAVAALEKAYNLQPNPSYAFLLGELYLATGQNKAGARLYSKLINRQPDEEAYYLQKALFLVRNQEIDEAIKVYNDLEKRIGLNAELSRRKHSLYLGMGDNKKAERELMLLIEKFPRNLEYRHLLAGFYLSLNQPKKAEGVFQDILAIEPADVKAQLALQEATGTGKTSGPQRSNELLTLFGRADVDVDLKVGKLLPIVQAVANTNNVDAADEGLLLAEELRRVHPDEAKGWAITGDLYFHSGRYSEAATAYQRTLALDDTVYPVWEQLLHALYVNNQLAELRKKAEEALDVFPNRPYISFYYAMGEAGGANFSEAVSLLQQADFIFSAVKPETGAVARTYLSVVEALAEDQSPQATVLPKGEGPLRTYLEALAAFNQSNYTRVIQMLQDVDHDNNTNALHLELLGDAFLAQNQKEQAATAYLRAKEAGSSSNKLTAKISQTRS
ncbi:MAG: tetratricopeptide repeat protein [Bacteroidota bacterium]